MTHAIDHSRNMIDLAGQTRERLVSLLTLARSFDDGTGMPKQDAELRARLSGKSVCNLFFEDSTRTRVSFSLAARNLGAGITNLTGPGSSVTKGETLVDTALTVEATGGHALVVRSGAAGAAELIAKHVHVPVINAGDGAHEHPTQGLLDVYALAAALGGGRESSFDLSGITVGIVGDIVNSRVARSDIIAMTKLGARVICVGPAPLAPRSLEVLGCEVSSDLDAVLGELDAVQMLRIQFERHGSCGSDKPGSPPGVGSVREYRSLYALTERRAGGMKPGAVIMHPGPMNRGLEMDGTVADGPNSVVRKQVSAGTLVRMAVLADLLGGQRAVLVKPDKMMQIRRSVCASLSYRQTARGAFCAAGRSLERSAMRRMVQSRGVIATLIGLYLCASLAAVPMPRPVASFLSNIGFSVADTAGDGACSCGEASSCSTSGSCCCAAKAATEEDDVSLDDGDTGFALMTISCTPELKWLIAAVPPVFNAGERRLLNLAELKGERLVALGVEVESLTKLDVPAPPPRSFG